MLALLEVYAHHSLTDPHRLPYGRVIEKIMRWQAPDSDDMAVIVQAFAMDPIMCTIDLQDMVDEINSRFGTSHTITGR